MKRLTYKDPKDNFFTALNLFYCKDGTTWVRGGGLAPDYPDVKLDDWIRGVIKKFKADIDSDSMNDEELNMVLAELTIFEDMETIENLIALVYNAAWAFSALNARLMEYEDAEEQGLLVRLPCKVGDTYYCVVRGYGGDRVEEVKLRYQYIESAIRGLGKWAFSTREEAEAALAKEAGK